AISLLSPPPPRPTLFPYTTLFRSLNDVLVIVAVTVITVFTDLATAVLCGIIIAALNFAWHHARELYADSHHEADGSKLYRVHGRSEEHTSELQSRENLVCRLLLEK